MNQNNTTNQTTAPDELAKARAQSLDKLRSRNRMMLWIVLGIIAFTVLLVLSPRPQVEKYHDIIMRIEPRFNDIGYAANMRIPVMLGETSDERWGFVDRWGEEIVPTHYEDVRPFGYGLAAVKSEGLWGFVNTDGIVVIDFRFSDAGRFRNQAAPVLFYYRWGLIDNTGEFTLPPQYMQIIPLGYGYFQVTDNDGNIDTVDRFGNIANDRTHAEEEPYWYINETVDGFVLTYDTLVSAPFTAYAVRYISEGLFAFQLVEHGLWGVISIGY